MKDARSFASAAQAEQRYGGQPYETHLAAVVQVLCDFDYGQPYRQAGWAVTGLGAARQERNARIYAGLRVCPDAAAVKLADRIANVEAAAPGSDHMARYVREADAFEAVVRPHVSLAMCLRL